MTSKSKVFRATHNPPMENDNWGAMVNHAYNPGMCEYTMCGNAQEGWADYSETREEAKYNEVTCPHCVKIINGIFDSFYKRKGKIYAK